MGSLRIATVLMAGSLFFCVFLSACGGMEHSGGEQATRPDASSGASGAKINKVGESGAGDGSVSAEVDAGAAVDGSVSAEVDAGAAGEVGEGDDMDAGDDVGDVWVEDDDEAMQGCVQMCAMLSACHSLPDSVVDEEDCRLGCEQSLEDGALMERDIRCVERADDCRDLDSCMQNFWGCDEPCNSFMSCELEEEMDACRTWCGVGIGSGAVRVEQFYCMEEFGRTQVCDEMVEECGLDWLL